MSDLLSALAPDEVKKLKAEIKWLNSRLQMAAGLISTMDDWKDKHPDECLNWVMSWEVEA